MVEVTDTATVVIFAQVEELSIERQGDLWAAESMQYPGLVGYGHTPDKAIQNARESLADRLRGPAGESPASA